ncbi:hypothetical protein [Paenibacillus oryzae]|nr:hypothetical protein [Paenibacillus oryzae]
MSRTEISLNNESNFEKVDLLQAVRKMEAKQDEMLKLIQALLKQVGDE